VNRYTGIVKGMFKWGVSHEYCSPLVHQALTTVEGLRVGRSRAKETEPFKPVPESHIEAVREVLPPTLQAMVDLQLACGARPGEILELRPCDIDRSGPVWTAVLSRHKTIHHGKERVLYFGPKAQAILRPFLLDRGPADYLFRPQDATAQRHADAKVHRRPNQPETPRKTDRTVGACYDTYSYRRAIARACEAINAARTKQGLPAIPVWHPHQLRHNAATRIRKEYGLEAAQLILGHAKADVTQLYAEINREKALEVAKQIG